MTRPCDHLPGDKPGDRKARIEAAHAAAAAYVRPPAMPATDDQLDAVARTLRPYWDVLVETSRHTA